MPPRENPSNPALQQMTLAPVRSTGLNSLVPQALPPRTSRSTKDPVWKLCIIIDGNDVKNPLIKCLRCNMQLAAGASRFKDHLFGNNRMTKCAGKDEDDDDERKALIQKIAAECSEKETAKKRKASVALVNAAAAGGDIAQPRTALGSQQKQKALLFDYQGADPAVARFFYGCNIPALVVEHPLFKDMAKALACAPAGYKLPNRMSLMYGSLLDRTVRELRTEEAPIREVVMKYGGTVISDGWDDVTRNHLVNLIVGTCKASFFDGTIELRSEDSEVAQFISDLLISHIDRQGKLAIVQICTDTCSVMKAAWKRVLDVLPWITATCCGTHVVSLELNDIGKIKEVAAVMKKVRKVLNLFWGRKRWPRTQLRKVISDNHDGKKFGLYRAKPTRFAGRYREMARMLRVKADLQAVVISAAYAEQRFVAPKRRIDEDEDESDDDEEGDVGATVKAIILDDHGFWKPMTQILSVGMPLLKLLRMMDGDKPVLGKVYDKMFLVGEKLKKMQHTIPWAAQALKIHESRWEYLHSDFHAAAYALDPEFMETNGDLDNATQVGVLNVFERLSLREAMLEAEEKVEDPMLVTASDRAVISRVAQAEREFASYQQREGPFTRLSAIQNAKEMAPATWWSTYGRHLELVCKYAQIVLAQPAAASVAERNWSVYGEIKTSRRTRLHVLHHEALVMHRKVTDAGYKQELEKWESDSDSDDSDDEGDESKIKALMM